MWLADFTVQKFRKTHDTKAGFRVRPTGGAPSRASTCETSRAFQKVQTEMRSYTGATAYSGGHISQAISPSRCCMSRGGWGWD